jgi:deoxyribodipyrimidine photo-lyase
MRLALLGHSAHFSSITRRNRGAVTLAGLSINLSPDHLMKSYDRALVWFRRDLRSFDHAALHHALASAKQVFCVFIFDKDILDPLLAHGSMDRRVAFIHASLRELDEELRQHGGGLIVQHARAAEAIPALAKTLNIDAVFCNHDYEPYAQQRDQDVADTLAGQHRKFLSFKDQVIFEKDEVLSQVGNPFSVFTPYKNAWLKKFQPTIGVLDSTLLPHFDVQPAPGQLSSPTPNPAMPSLAEMGFEDIDLSAQHLLTGMQGGQQLIDDFLPRLSRYGEARDFPSIKGPSYLSVHLRFGTVSVRALARHAMDAIRSGTRADGAAVWLAELVWRDFYFMILHHHPKVAEGAAFKVEYDRIAWEEGPQADALFAAWCEGRTGYPLVDAAMLQLNRSGYMHNRLRMVTACFLIKDLGIDWRRGEAYFARMLNDFDLSANNGGWQWAASSGCDAQPYFRIFNPITQSQKFDTDGKFIKRYLPQLEKLDSKHIHAPWLAPSMTLQMAGITLGENYPAPVVQHDEARKNTLARYAVVKKS